MGRHDRTQIEQGMFGDSLWEMALRQPRAPLRPYVRSIVGYDEQATAAGHQRQFPAPTVTLIIEFGSPLRVALGGEVRVAARHPGGFVAGLVDTYAITEHNGSQRGVQVDLTPTGARRFFGMPMSELAGRVVALGDVFPAGLGSLTERLDEAPDWATRLDLVEELAERHILGARIDTRRVDWAVAQIEAAGGMLDVGSLAHLSRDVRQFTGLTPTEARKSLSELADLFG